MVIKSDIEFFEKESMLLAKKRIKLLESIDKTGSILQAAKEVPLSYKGAWDIVDSMNNLSSTPLVEKSENRKHGGGTKLTEYGKKIVKLYKKLSLLQDEFFKNIEDCVDLNSGEFKMLQRMGSKISARNQLVGVVSNVKIGRVNSEIELILKAGETIYATITKESALELELKEGLEAVAIFKSSSVILIKESKNATLSSKNRFRGRVVKIESESVNAEVVLELKGGELICATVTKDALRDLSLNIQEEVEALIEANSIIVGI